MYQQMWIVVFHLNLHNMQVCRSQWIILCYVFFHLLQKVTYYLYFNLIQTHFQSIEYNFQVFFLYSGPVWNIHYLWCNKLVQFNCKQKSTQNGMILSYRIGDLMTNMHIFMIMFKSFFRKDSYEGINYILPTS